MKNLSLQRASQAETVLLATLDKHIFTNPWSKQAFAEAIDAGKEFWIAYQQDQAVGYCGIFNAIDTAEILNIGVLANYQGQGIGYILLQKTIERAQAWGCEQICLEVRESNQKAQDFYRRQGFIELAKRKNYYPPENNSLSRTRETAVIMKYTFC